MTKDSVSPPIVVIVGLGMVAQRFCDALRERPGSHQARIIVFGEEPRLAYDRIRLGALLASPGANLELADEHWYREREIELHLGEPVVRIDRIRKQVYLRSGRTQAYDALVLATGARARVPAVAGLSARDVLTYRTMQDALRIREACRDRRSVAILGGGLLGLECGDALAKCGLAVTVLEAGPHLLPRQLDAASSQVLAQLLHERGLRLQVGYKLLRVERGTGGFRLFGESTTPLEVDVLVVAAGVVPESRLASAAGILCAQSGGILVDDGLATDDPAIFALGDCVSHRGITPGLVAPGYRMAEVLAARLRGDQNARFEGVNRGCELKIGGIPVVAFGRYELQSELGCVRHRTERCARSLVVEDGRLVGATFVGEWEQRFLLQDAVLGGRPLSQAQLAGFAATGSLPIDDLAPVSSWPPQALVCQCARVTRGELGELVKCGHTDVCSLQQVSRAGTVCGSCVPLLAELVGVPTIARPKIPFARAVGLLSALTLAVAAGHFALPPLPPSPTVQAAIFQAEQLWRSNLFRQWTGFALMGLFTLGLLLSLRKRVRWFRWGNFGAFRALHTALGLGSLAALYLHTGLRFGAHLNLLLMCVFIAACTLGALTGLLVYLEHQRGGARVRALRGRMARAHLWLLWPLPALLGFHIFAAYYF
jgi:nitrite reductase (NADH) large subunit